MNQLKAMLRTDIYAAFGFNSRSKGKNTRNILLFALLGLYMLAILVFFTYTLADGLNSVGMIDLILVLPFMVSSMFVLMVCIYKMPSYLFAFKDYDMLMSLPIKRSTILSAKLLTMYAGELAVTLLISVPMLGVYAYFAKPDFIFYINALIATIILPVFPMIVGAISAFLLGLLAAKSRFKNLVMLISSAVMILVVMVLSMSLSTSMDMSGEKMATSVAPVLSGMSMAFPVSFYMQALRQGDIAMLGLFMAIGIVLSLLLVAAFSRSFSWINAKFTEQHSSKKKYSEKDLKVSSPIRALFKRELKTYFGQYMYVLNTIIGSIMMIILAVVVVFSGKEFFSSIAFFSMGLDMPAAIIAVGMTFLISMSCVTSASISADAKTLWLTYSLPIKTMDIFKSKLLLNYMMIIPPMLVSVVILSVALGFTVEYFLSLLAFELAYAIFIGLAGLVINLRLPKLDWKNIVVVVKQSASVCVVIFGGMILTFLLVLLFINLNLPLITFELCAAAFFIIADIVLYILLKNWGVKRFNTLLDNTKVTANVEVMNIK